MYNTLQPAQNSDFYFYLNDSININQVVKKGLKLTFKRLTYFKILDKNIFKQSSIKALEYCTLSAEKKSFNYFDSTRQENFSR